MSKLASEQDQELQYWLMIRVEEALVFILKAPMPFIQTGRKIASSDTLDLCALPGNSGGAVLNKAGELVGILASGDGNVNEVIPASLIKKIRDRSSEEHRDAF